MVRHIANGMEQLILKAKSLPGGTAKRRCRHPQSVGD